MAPQGVALVAGRSASGVVGGSKIGEGDPETVGDINSEVGYVTLIAAVVSDPVAVGCGPDGSGVRLAAEPIRPHRSNVQNLLGQGK